jgi:autonomous glycyl radical cofactor GrcA
MIGAVSVLSGTLPHAIRFVRLTRDQQMDVINRTFHGAADA